MHNKPDPVTQPIQPFAESFQLIERVFERAKASFSVDKTVDEKPNLLDKRKEKFLDVRMLILDIDLQTLQFKNQLRDIPLSDEENVSLIQTEIALLRSLAIQAHIKKMKCVDELSQAFEAEIDAIQQTIGHEQSKLRSSKCAVEKDCLNTSIRQAKLKRLELEGLKDKWLG